MVKGAGKPDSNNKTWGFGLFTLSAPHDFGRALFADGTIVNIGQVVARVHHQFRSRRDKVVRNQAHPTAATIAHLGTVTLADAVVKNFDRHRVVSAKVRSSRIFHLINLSFHIEK